MHNSCAEGFSSVRQNGENMKKFFALFLIIVMVAFCFASCGEPEDNGNTNTNGGSENSGDGSGFGEGMFGDDGMLPALPVEPDSLS